MLRTSECFKFTSPIPLVKMKQIGSILSWQVPKILSSILITLQKRLTMNLRKLLVLANPNSNLNKSPHQIKIAIRKGMISVMKKD